MLPVFDKNHHAFRKYLNKNVVERNMNMLKPLKMKPTFKNYIWGGQNLKKVYGKDNAGENIAESWEVSSREEGLSYVAEGEDEGLTIKQLMQKYGKDFCGESIDEKEEFPLLFKLIDANDKLSIQVHPDDDYAYINENQSKGKTEAWYVLHAEPGSFLIYGFNEQLEKTQLREILKNGNEIEKYLNKVECKKGDCFFIQAGTIHAIGAGLIIAEIQQNSNITYRLYDYNRRDKNGNLRELHIEKSLDVISLEKQAGTGKVQKFFESDGDNLISKTIANKYFCMEEIMVKSTYQSSTNSLLNILFIAEGHFKLGDMFCNEGDSIIIPAGMGEYILEGQGTVLKFYVPKQ